MSSITRFAPKVARTATLFHQRHMASATASDPVQKLFVEKVREFKATNKGLDQAHEKALAEEMLRLKRVFSVEDESKLGQLEARFPSEHTVSLHDIDENKAKRTAIAKGEHQKQLEASSQAAPSALLASIPEQVTHDLHLPPFNKPDYMLMLENLGVPKPPVVGNMVPDIEAPNLDPMTPKKLERELGVEFGENMPTINDDKSPERDTVNFPRLKQELYSPPTRFHIIPDSWFQFFHPKTGVSGPYTFAGTFLTFLLSKEWLIMEHEILAGISMPIIFAYAFYKFGPNLTKYLDSKLEQEDKDWDEWQHGHIQFLEGQQRHYKGELDKKALIKELYNIRRQDVDVQLEAENRRRIKTIYEDTRRRLNYLVSVADSKRQIHQKNMVNWVISNAVSSIGPKQETEVLDSCISDLKKLASKNANVI